jgi:tRNA pseudouridine55 synthase
MNAPAQPGAGPSGLLLIDKPRGPTSMDVCRRVRRRLIAGGAPRRVKVGHAGTLDPLADGLLIVLVGRCTRLCDAYMAGTKEYLARVDLSAVTTTDDAEGQRTPVQVDSPPDRACLERACRALTGWVLQRPPAYSAVKLAGREAYKVARAIERRAAPRPEGDAAAADPAPLRERLRAGIDLPARRVRIDAIDLLAYDWPVLDLRVVCGKGVYIRALARDLGAALGTGGTLLALRRTRIGRCTVDRATPLDALPDTLSQRDLCPPEALPADTPPAGPA